MSWAILRDEIKTELKCSWDLSAIAILSLLLALFIYLMPDNPARIVLGLPFILFFPGHVLIATLFPEKKSLDLIERIALSFGLSIAVVPLIGFGLNYTPFGIRLEPILWSLILFNIAFSILGIWRRATSDDPFLPFEPTTLWAKVNKEFRRETKLDKILTIILVVAILSSVLSLAYVVAMPRQGEQFTEFYYLNSEGNAFDYPNNLTVGEQGTVIIGIANHEQRTINYTVEIWLVNATYANNTIVVEQLYFVDSLSAVLDSVPANTEGDWTKQWEQAYSFTVPFSGQYKLFFVLLKDGQPYDGDSMVDIADTPEKDVFLSKQSKVSSKDYLGLNLNLNVT